LALRPQHRADRFLGGLAFVTGGAVLFFTLSRGGWLGMAVWLPLFFGLYLLAADSRGVAVMVTARLREMAPWPALSGALVLVLALVAGAGLWQSRPQWLFHDTASLRYDAAATAVRIFEDRPVFGAGPSAYGLLYDVNGGQHPGENIHPHNAYLSLLTDVGLVGGIVVLAGGVLVALALLHACRGASRDQAAYVSAAAAAFAATLAHGLVDSPGFWNAVLVPIAIVLAIAMRLSGLPVAPKRALSLRNASRWAVLLLILPVTLVGWTFFDRSHAAYDLSLRLIEEGRLVEGAAKAIEAADNDPSFAPYQIHAGVSQAILYLDQQREGTADPALLDRAIDFFQRGLESEPRSAIAYANLAEAWRLKGDSQKAVEVARLALISAPKDGTAASLAATIFEWAGLRDEAVQAYAIAFDADLGLTQFSLLGHDAGAPGDAPGGHSGFGAESLRSRENHGYLRPLPRAIGNRDAGLPGAGRRLARHISPPRRSRDHVGWARPAGRSPR
jgi:tetratricopeptide (TPR) repeat protein